MGSADPIQLQGITPLNMGTKMKGLLKGLRYISQIFDEEKDQEIEIGFPTDVKHVAHIGWDGPAVDNPSWMKEFKAPPAGHSAPLDMTGAPPEVSEDSSQRSARSEDSSHRASRSQEQPPREPREGKPARHRHRSMENALDPDSTGKEASVKSRHSRKHHSKGSSEGSCRGRHSQDPSAADDSSTSKLPDIPKKSRRKKSKEESVDGGKPRSRSKSSDSKDASNPTPEVKSFVTEEGGRAANSEIMT